MNPRTPIDTRATGMPPPSSSGMNAAMGTIRATVSQERYVPLASARCPRAIGPATPTSSRTPRSAPMRAGEKPRALR